MLIINYNSPQLLTKTFIYQQCVSDMGLMLFITDYITTGLDEGWNRGHHQDNLS